MNDFKALLVITILLSFAVTLIKNAEFITMNTVPNIEEYRCTLQDMDKNKIVSAEDIKNVPNIMISGYYTKRSVITAQNGNGSDAVLAFTDGFFPFIYGLELESGYFWDDMPYEYIPAVISDKTAEKLFVTKDVTGLVMFVEDTQYIITGVYSSKLGFFNYIFIPYSKTSMLETIGISSGSEALISNLQYYDKIDYRDRAVFSLFSANLLFFGFFVVTLLYMLHVCLAVRSLPLFAVAFLASAAVCYMGRSYFNIPILPDENIFDVKWYYDMAMRGRTMLTHYYDGAPYLNILSSIGGFVLCVAVVSLLLFAFYIFMLREIKGRRRYAASNIAVFLGIMVGCGASKLIFFSTVIPFEYFAVLCILQFYSFIKQTE